MTASLRRLVSMPVVAAALALALHAPPVLASFPGPNGPIAFQSTVDGKTNLYSIDADVSGLAQLTHGNFNDADPDLSPGGERVAFSRFTGQINGNRDVFVLDVASGEETRLTTNKARDLDPAWAPDATWVVFASSRNDLNPNSRDCRNLFAGTCNFDLYTINADGTSEVRLTTTSATDVAPQVSPDGSRIAFASFRNGAWAIYVIDANGGNEQKLTPDSMQASLPDWSPDGTNIIFVNNACVEESCTESDIFVMDADGSDITQLTDDLGNNLYPSYSPDGTRIAFCHNADLTFPPADIFVINADGTNPTNVTNSPSVNDFAPDWGS
jgi:Tol biopolymer transport system component